jgi:asparagine synthase (glutamine-hydrolysing)
MCGIAGFTARVGASDAEAAILDMVAALGHRGPDGSGWWSAEAGDAGRRVTLGHTRLAIIDLTAGALQPFQSGPRGGEGPGPLTLVFNGEIYNYLELRAELAAKGFAFRTTSDTEVLLAAYAVWGAGCLPRLRGMYAFAIWDARNASLFLARDPFGKKPLLYFEDRGDLVFASELGALAAHPGFRPRIDEAALAQYLLYKYVPGPATLVAGVRELPPGHMATWRAGELRLERHYLPPCPDPDPARRLPWGPVTVAGFRAALGEAVALRMRSDVPLGAFLSGGLDSSAIVALMAERSERPVKTFSVGFRERSVSELWAARIVAERFGTEHHELEITPEDFLASFEAVTARRGAPLSEMADIPVYLLSRLAAREVKVVLSGEGADELLAGYPKHWGDLAVGLYQSTVPRALDAALLGGASASLGYRARRLQVFLRAAREPDFLDRQAAWFGLMSRAEARRLCPGLEGLDARFHWPEDPGAAAGPLHRGLMFDKTVWLPGTLLERGDRLTMAASIEARMPYMDTGLHAFAAQLPDQAYLAGRVGKQVLRQAFADVLPEEVLARPKAGFRVPVHEWLRGGLNGFLHDTLLAPSAALASYCDRAVLAGLVAEHEAGRQNREKELWSLLALEVFLGTLRGAPAAPRQAPPLEPARAPRLPARAAAAAAAVVTAAAAAAAAPALPLASVVVPTYRRPDLLAGLLAALGSQAAAEPPGSVEVIVVDNCHEASARRVCDAAALPGLAYVHEPRAGVVHARNAGVAAARGTYVIFLDDDEMPGPGWLASWLAQAAAGVEAAFGPVLPRYAAEPGASRRITDRMFSRDFALPTGADVTRQLVRLGTGNSMFRRARLAGRRTFDPSFNGTGGEDLHLIRRLVGEGVRLSWNREAAVGEVVTAERMTLGYLRQRRFNQAQLRCRLTLLAGGAFAWPRLGFWMLAGAAQAALSSTRGLVAQATGRPDRDLFEIDVQGGLGKLFWYRGETVPLYARGDRAVG